MTLGEVIKKFRKENYMTMEEFAKRTGLSKGYISMLEKDLNPKTNREIIPSYATMMRISDVMSIDVDSLFSLLDCNQPIEWVSPREVKQTLSIRLKALRKNAGITQEQLAAAIGVERSTVSMWETVASQPDNQTLCKIAEYFNVSVDFLLGVTPKKSKKIPVLGHVAAGIPIEAVTDILDYEEITEEMANAGDYFALQIRGDSMEPRISDGDVVIVRQQPEVENGEIAIIRINGDNATCKRYIKHDNGISLISLNPSYPPMFYTAQEIEEKPVQIIGRVVELRAKF